MAKDDGGGAVKRPWYCLALLLVAFTVSLWAAHWERDETGRAVAVPDQVHRVVSLSPSITNTVYALGAAGELVGITDYTAYPPEAVRQKPSVGAVVNPSLERIIALHPDLVLALPDFNGAALTQLAIARISVAQGGELWVSICRGSLSTGSTKMRCMTLSIWRAPA